MSGRPLKQTSLGLSRAAVEHLRRLRPGGELHVLRTGGLETGADLAAAERAGVSLTGWYTGYFGSLATHGHALYREIYRETLEELRNG